MEMPTTSTDPEEDWQNLSDAATRRRIQNRIAQRNYRRNIRKRLRELEEQASSASATNVCTVFSRQRNNSVDGREDAISAPRDNSTRKRKNSHKILPSRAIRDQPEVSFSEDNQWKQSLSNSTDPLEAPYDPVEVVSSSETIALFDPSTLWNLPTSDESARYAVMSTEWPDPQSVHESTNQISKALGLSDDDKYLAGLQDDMVDMRASCVDGQTTLHLGAKKGHQAIVAMLLDRGVNVDDTDVLGQSALHIAAAGGHQTVVQLLIGRGAGVYLKDACGRTSLHLAAENGHTLTLQSLLQQKPAKEVKDALGRTPLHVATEHGHEDIVRLLLDNGADPRARVSP